MWEQAIANCIEDETKRSYLVKIPMWILASVSYELDWVLQIEFVKYNQN